MLTNTMKQLAALRPSMERAVVRAIGERGDTQDIVSTAIAKAIEAIDTFDPAKGSLSSWALRIASNEARNWARMSCNRGHFSEVGEGEDDHVSAVDLRVAEDGNQTVEMRCQVRAIYRAMGTLTEDERTVLHAIAEGKTQREAGLMVGWSPVQTTRRLPALFARLRGEWEESEDE